MRQMWPRSSRRARIAVAVTFLLAFGALTGTVMAKAGLFASSQHPWPYAPTPAAPVLAAVGDISCQPSAPVDAEKQSDVCDKTGTGYTTRWQAQTATANQVEALHPNLVAILGDEQYQVGRYEDFMGSFDHTYGAFKFLQRPTPGNHEFYTSHGETGVGGYGYFDYYNGYQVNPDNGQASPTHNFGTSASAEPTPRQSGQAGQFGDSGNGWYSYNLGGWHIISLNAECNLPSHGSCDTSAPWYQTQTKWLAADLRDDHSACTLAYWHQPTFSGANPSSSAPGGDPEGPAADVWWKLLYAHHTDLVLNGHDHLYARFAPMNPAGEADANGIREFIVGTGGESLDTLNASAPNLQNGTGNYYGVMRLTLAPHSYQWNFASAPDAPSPGPGSYSDTGSTNCHSGS